MNQVNIIGNLGANPELRYTSAGKPVCNFGVAINEYFGGKSHTEWVPVTVWGDAAERAVKHLEKGSKVQITGKLRTRSFKDKNEVERYKTEVHCNFVTYLSKKQAQGGEDFPPLPDDIEEENTAGADERTPF